MSDGSDRTLTPSLSLNTLPALECDNLPAPELRSTPFAYSAISERFEYPFPVTQALPSPENCAPTPSASTDAFTNGSIVPPSSTGRGTNMSPFTCASFSPCSPPVNSPDLPYPPASAAIAALQSLKQTQFRDANSAVSQQHRSASQQFALASRNPPMPPSLALKRRSLKLVRTADGRLGTEGGRKL